MTLHAWLARVSAMWWPAAANHLWQATLFAVAAIGLTILLQRTMRRSSAQTRYLVLLVALLKFAAPSALFVAAAGPLLNFPSNLAGDLLQVRVFSEDTILFASRAVHPIEMEASREALSTGAGVPHNEAYCILSLLWLLGGGAVVSRWARRHIALRRTIRLASPISQGPLREALERICRQLSIRRNVVLAASDQIEQPGLWGVWRPVVILPMDIEARLGARRARSAPRP